MVLDQEDAHAATVAYAPNFLAQLLDLLVVEAGGRLVEQEEQGIARQRPRQFDPLLRREGEAR